MNSPEISPETIRKVYTNTSGANAFSNPNYLYEHFKGKVSVHKIKEALSGVEGFTSHHFTPKPRFFNPFRIYNRRSQC